MNFPTDIGGKRKAMRINVREIMNAKTEEKK